MPTHFWVTFTWPKMRLEAFVQAYLAGPTERAAFLGTPVQTVKNRLHAGSACHRVPRRSRPGPPRPIFSDLRTNGARRAGREGANRLRDRWFTSSVLDALSIIPLYPH